MTSMRITIVTGADGAPFVLDFAALLDADDELAVIVPIVRDQWLTGLKASPDLDAFLTGGGDATHAVSDGLDAMSDTPPTGTDQRTTRSPVS